MKVREFRRTDAPALFALMKTEFPEEEAVLGMRAEGFSEVIRRLYRADLRVFLGLARLVGRSPFHLYVLEQDGALAGTTLLSFARRAGFLSNVVVAPEFRRRGIARRLIETARATAARRRKPYVVLRVLSANTPARTLYLSAGYEVLDHQAYVVHDRPAAFAPAPTPAGIRPFERRDAPALSAIATATLPSKVRDVLPFEPRELTGISWVDRLFRAETAGWVVDRGHGPEAHVSATSTPTTEAAHLSSPIVAEGLEPALVAELIRVAGRWLGARAPARILSSVAEYNLRGRRALEEVGFHDAFPLDTLYRPSA
ncbi:MAG TPA: GNAT family N-acetyltransferase [Thermoplasmata archaeon]|nr:GNAT family N-acetyltransferase [Thermoplasmata archaeon]